jgi:hypothetical protein
MDHGKAATVRKVVTQPTQRYKGCLASRLQPADYDHCLDNYDDEQFQNIGLVPTALKQRVYDKGGIVTRGILKETLTRKTNTISDIPFRRTRTQFKDYFEQKRHELGLLKSVLRNLSSDDKRKLQAYYIQNKTIEPKKFSDIIASFHADAFSARRTSQEGRTI